MRAKPIILGTLAYVTITFPLAVVWHLGIFEAAYNRISFLVEEPSFLLGFIAVLIQGIVLSAGYGFTHFSGSPTLRGLKYAAMMGIFFWTSHVIAYAAKHSGSNDILFYGLETAYLIIQFGIYGLIIGNLYSRITLKQ